MEDKLGYINGYINEKGEVEGNQTLEVINTQIYPTIDDNTFRYGLDYNDPNFYYEEDTILGYNIIVMKDDSPLFNNKLKNSAKNFINNYSNIPEIARRDNMLAEFQNYFFKIFDGDFNSDVKNKTYYINKIEGLDNLEKFIVDYEKDTLKITLKEDITMISNYIRELYLNLSYSFKNQRYLIPSNSLRFDMKIKYTDYRKFRIPTDAGNTTSMINENPSAIIYTLHDCNLSLPNSIIPNSLQMAGDTISKTISDLEFEIIYKSVEKEILPLMIPNSLQLNNKKAKIILNSNDVEGGRSVNESSSYSMFKNVSNQKIAEKTNTYNDSGLNRNFEKTLYNNNPVEKSRLDQIVYNAQKALERNVNRAVRDITDVRNSLLNNLIYEISNFVKIPVTFTEDINFNILDIRKLLYDNLQARKVGDIRAEEAEINRKGNVISTNPNNVINDNSINAGVIDVNNNILPPPTNVYIP